MASTFSFFDSVACECQKICGDLPEKTVFKSYAVKQERKSQYANLRLTRCQLFFAKCTAKRQRLPNKSQKHLALPKKMPTDAASSCWSKN